MKDILRNALFAIAAIAVGLVPVFASTPSSTTRVHAQTQIELVRGA